MGCSQLQGVVSRNPKGRSTTIESREEILSRAVHVLEEAETSGKVPRFVLTHIRNIVECLSVSHAELQECVGSAHAIARWYIDQGFHEVPVHVALSDIALDIIKLVSYE